MVNRNPEQDWFRVYVGEDAEFIVIAESGDYAEEAVKAHCTHEPYLMLDTGMMLDHGVWAKPLEPIDADYYQRITEMTGVSSIRLMTDKRKRAKQEREDKVVETLEIKGQLTLFGMQKALTNRTDVEYSYYYE